MLSPTVYDVLPLLATYVLMILVSGLCIYLGHLTASSESDVAAVSVWSPDWQNCYPNHDLKEEVGLVFTNSSKYGMYSPHCGLDNVLMAWGHDEYMYRALKHNDSKLPEVAHKIIRFHSFYPWHSAGDYMHLCNEDDMEVLTWVLEFNKYDLYTKCDRNPDLDEVMPYYQRLIDKYIPGVLNW